MKSVAFKKIMSTLMAVGIALTSGATQVQARESERLITDRAVFTKIAFKDAPEVLTNYQNELKLETEFEISDTEGILPGDYVSLQLPEDTVDYTFNFKDINAVHALMSNPNGDSTLPNYHFADVIVERSSIRIRFNENITKLKSVKGAANMTVNASQSLSDHDRSDTVFFDFGNSSKYLAPFHTSIKFSTRAYEAATPQSKLDFVGGFDDSRPLIYWDVYANSGQFLGITDYRIELTLGEGLEAIDPQQFTIDIGNDDGYSLSYEQFKADGGRIVREGNRVYISIPDVLIDQSRVLIGYVTHVVDDTHETYTSDIKVQYRQDGVLFEETKHAALNSVFSTGTGSGKLPEFGVLRIENRDLESGDPLEGIHVSVRTTRDDTVESTSISNQYGINDFELNTNEYQVTVDEMPDYLTLVSESTQIVQMYEKSMILTLNYQIKKKDITATKIWNGGTLEKPTITFELYQNGMATGVTKEIKNGTSNATFEAWPIATTKGVPLNYSVKELDTPANYTATVSEDGLTVTNTYASPKTTITAHKVWVGGSENRPTIHFELYQNGKATGIVKALEKGVTDVDFTNVDATDAHGVPFTYSVKEIEVPMNYKAISSHDGLTITNFFQTDFINIRVKNKWFGGPRIKPNTEIELYRNGHPTGIRILLENGEMEAVFEDVPAMDPNGEFYNYSVRVINPSRDYDVTYGKSGLIIYNTFIEPELVEGNTPTRKPHYKDPSTEVLGVKKKKPNNQSVNHNETRLPNTGMNASVVGVTTGGLILGAGLLLVARSLKRKQ